MTLIYIAAAIYGAAFLWGLGSGIAEQNRKNREAERAAEEAAEQQREGDAIRAALVHCLHCLGKQKATGYHPWISGCLGRMNSPVYPEADVAVLALRKTAEELEGTHYDPSPCYEAIERIKGAVA